MSLAEKLNVMAKNQQLVFEAGKRAGTDEFWNSFTVNGTRTDYQYACLGVGWNDTTFKPTVVIKPTIAKDMFSNTKIEGALYTDKLDFSRCQNFQQCFINAGMKKLKKIDMRNAHEGMNGMSSTFHNCKNLETIDEFYPPYNSKFVSTFYLCTALKNITFMSPIKTNGLNFSVSTLLTHDSLMSVINNLYDYSASSTTHSVTLGSTNLAKLTDEEKQIATDKGWTLA